NPVLEEGLDGAEELTPEELQPMLEAEAERTGDPADKSILEATTGPAEPAEMDGAEFGAEFTGTDLAPVVDGASDASAAPEVPEAAAADPFDEIDLGDYFDNYLDPGFKSPASENVEKPSFETFLSSPVTLSDHLRSQLALVAMSQSVRDAAEEIIGNLDGNG